MFVSEIGRKQYPTIADLTLRCAEIISAFTVMQDIIDHGENASELWFKLEKETPVTENENEEESVAEENIKQPDSITEEPEPSTEEENEEPKKGRVDYETISP